MLLKQIKYFHAVVETGNFHDAAEKCCVTQSAISQQIIKLEEELGVKLFKRQGRKVALNKTGELFYQRSLVILSDLEALIFKCRTFANQKSKNLKLGCVDCYKGTVFSEVLQIFAKKHPELVFDTTVRCHEELFRELESGHLDLVLNDQRRAFSSSYLNVEIAKLKIYVEISVNEHLSKQQTIEIETLKNLSCIIINSPYNESEMSYLKENIGILSDFILVNSLSEAELKIQTGHCFRLTDGDYNNVNSACARLPLVQNREFLYKNYCAFLKADHLNDEARLFLTLLQQKFREQS